jgi:NMD protein affecting ribosome stability and mRNA decay
MVEPDIACDKCGSAEEDESMLLCDACDTGFHTFCLKPKVTVVPDGDWFCPHCLGEYKRDGYTTRWRTALKEDYEVRAQDMSGKWLDGKVVEREGKKVLVHFTGWNSKYDEWCVLWIHTHTHPVLPAQRLHRSRLN